MSKSNPSKSRAKVAKRALPLSKYNIFFILERELHFQEKGYIPKKHVSNADRLAYGDLVSSFPPRPSRYRSLELSEVWFLKRTLRSRDRSKKSRGVISAISSSDLSKIIGQRWKTCGEEEKNYVTFIADAVKNRFLQIELSERKKDSLPCLKNDLSPSRRSEKRESEEEIDEGPVESPVKPVAVPTVTRATMPRWQQQQQQQQLVNPCSLNFHFDRYAASNNAIQPAAGIAHQLFITSGLFASSEEQMEIAYLSAKLNRIKAELRHINFLLGREQL